ncbi:hypothetical protein ACWD4G_04975 [Streptomyces sp. NPDC002643]
MTAHVSGSRPTAASGPRPAPAGPASASAGSASGPRPAPAGSASASVSASPEELLAGADRLLGTATVSATGVWPRAAALLLRHALEEALRSYWRRTRPELARCPMHAQALCLETYLGPDTARRWSTLWAGLSRACHYHGYELSPTAGELRAWRDETERLLGELAVTARDTR